MRTNTGGNRIPARKRFGQNFLEPAWVAKVISAIAPQPDETFLEIGPGRGALTRPLAARAKQVVAFEIDRDLAADLRATMPPNVRVEEGDFLHEGPGGWGLGAGGWPVRVAGNLPYNVASPIMFSLVEAYRNGAPLVDATLMLQREVADRLTASPGTKDFGVLTVLIGLHATVDRLLALPPGAFRPAPKVRSALVRLTFHPPQSAIRNPPSFEAMVQAIFTRRRKTLANALLAYPGARRSPAAALAEAGIDGSRRPETLSIAELARLSDALS